ncbi:HYC_CC_PP family protein [Aestuariivivens marinum]
MKQLLHKVISVFMAFLVFFSTMSFTVNMHYCGDVLVEMAIFKKAKGCGMEMQNPSTDSCSVSKKNCCSDEQSVVNGQDELKLPIDQLSFEQQQFVVSFIHAYLDSFEGFNKNINVYKAYKPPLVVRQIYKLDETYLI